MVTATAEAPTVRPKRKSAKDEHISAAGLTLGRGWTKTAIEKFLDPPDKTSPNPHYRSGAPMKLYLLTRVKRKEKIKAYLAWLQDSAARRVRAQATADKRRAATIAAVQAWQPKLGETMSMPDVTAAAIAHYNERQLDRSFDRGRDPGEPARLTSDRAFLQRIAVNYLRHEVTDYEQVLADLTTQIGKDDAYLVVRKRVLEAIGNAYPELATETARQTSRTH